MSATPPIQSSVSTRTSHVDLRRTATDKFDLAQYFSTMKVMGRFHNVGLPDAPLPQMKTDLFMPGGYSMGASHIGNRPEMEAMLKLAADKRIKPWVECLKVGEEGCKQAVERVKSGDIRYRFTLTGFDGVFGART